MERHRCTAALLTLLLLGPLQLHLVKRVEASSAPQRGVTAPDHVVTLADYFERGQMRADDWIRQHRRLTGTDLTAVIRRSLDACVRVLVERDAGGGRRSTVLGSGVIIDGGTRVLTAGHALDHADGARVRVTLRDGREIEARLVDHRYDVAGERSQDWAVVKLIGIAPGELPHVRIGDARAGGVALVLGYPDRFGLDDAGRVAHGFVREGRRLDPLLFVARVSMESPDQLDPLAGAIPMGGASGSPILDERGHLIGVLVGVGRLGYPEGVKHVYQMAPVNAYQNLLALEAPVMTRSATR